MYNIKNINFVFVNKVPYLQYYLQWVTLSPQLMIGLSSDSSQDSVGSFILLSSA